MTNEAQAGRAFIESAIQLKAAANAVGISSPADFDRVLSLGTAVANYLRSAPLRALKEPRFETICDKDGKYVIARDLVNGLEWDVAEFGGKTMDHEDAMKACAELRTGGHADWRLPTRRELLTLVDDTRHDPAIDKEFFPNCQAAWYWTSTPYAPGPGFAWIVGFVDGHSGGDYRLGRYCVRAVRASQ